MLRFDPWPMASIVMTDATPMMMPSAVRNEKNIELMEEFGVLTKTEMLSRYEVEMEHYSKILNIEARTMLKIANKQLIPAATAYMGELAGSAASPSSAERILVLYSSLITCPSRSMMLREE